MGSTAIRLDSNKRLADMAPLDARRNEPRVRLLIEVPSKRVTPVGDSENY